MKKYNYILLTLISVIFTIPLQSQTVINSLINANETWTPAGNPYLLNSNALIQQGVTVTIKPGTVIKATGKYRILIDGILDARGTKDSVIVFDTLAFEFTSKATGYDFNTGKGSNFDYCFFNGSGINQIYTLTLSAVDMYIRNCKFYNCYYCIYGINANQDTARVRIEKTIFKAGKEAGYAINPTGRYVFLEMDECLVEGMYGMFLANYSTITKCTFNRWISNTGLRIYNSNPNYFGKVILACNTFKNFANTVIELYGVPTSNHAVINNNTFDSAQIFIQGYAYTNPSGKRTMYIHDNNFLHYTKNTILFSGSLNPGKCDTLDFTGNYWKTSSSAQIEAGIYDFADDITVGVKINHSGALSSPVTDCEYQNPDFDNTSGVNLLEKTPLNFTLSPNPSNGTFRILTTETTPLNVYIFDLSGKQVFQQIQLSPDSPVTVNGMKQGVYVVKIATDSGYMASTRLVIY